MFKKQNFSVLFLLVASFKHDKMWDSEALMYDCFRCPAKLNYLLYRNILHLMVSDSNVAAPSLR
jgi:hypothetical protein